MRQLQTLNERTLADKDGESVDWLEIQSLEKEPLSLDGWFLTDDPEDLQKWRFPNVVIDPGGFLLVYTSGKDRVGADGELHANFKLSSKGEYLTLVDPDGKTVAHRYREYPAQPVDGPAGTRRQGGFPRHGSWESLRPDAGHLPEHEVSRP